MGGRGTERAKREDGGGKDKLDSERVFGWDGKVADRWGGCREWQGSCGEEKVLGWERA